MSRVSNAFLPQDMFCHVPLNQPICAVNFHVQKHPFDAMVNRAFREQRTNAIKNYELWEHIQIHTWTLDERPQQQYQHLLCQRLESVQLCCRLLDSQLEKFHPICFCTTRYWWRAKIQNRNQHFHGQPLSLIKSPIKLAHK